MASTLMMACNCGRNFSIYIPKVRLYAARFDNADENDIANWQDDDRAEQEAGEVGLAKVMSKAIGGEFSDGTNLDSDHDFRCPDRRFCLGLFGGINS